LKNNFFLEPYCAWWGSTRRLRRNHQKQPIIDRLGAAPASRRRAAPGAPRVTAAPVPTFWLRAAPEPARVPWALAPASRCKAAPGRMKTVEPSSSENRALDDIFLHPPQDSSRGAACRRGSRPNENRRADVEDLFEPGRCKATPIRSKRDRTQGVAADSYRIDPDPRW
jgi:hypothetical protein